MSFIDIFLRVKWHHLLVWNLFLKLCQKIDYHHRTTPQEFCWSGAWHWRQRFYFLRIHEVLVNHHKAGSRERALKDHSNVINFWSENKDQAWNLNTCKHNKWMPPQYFDNCNIAAVIWKYKHHRDERYLWQSAFLWISNFINCETISSKRVVIVYSQTKDSTLQNSNLLVIMIAT